MQKIAVLDLGTNTFHLLVAKVQNKQKVNVLGRKQIPVKLGENGLSKKKLAPAAIERGISAINSIKETLDQHNPDALHIYATSAFRSSKNASKLINYIESVMNAPVKIIDGKKEAELIYYGVRWALKDTVSTPYLVIDIGGGSIEFIVAGNNEIKYLNSVEIGAARLLEKFHHSDPIKQEEIDKLESFLEKKLKDTIDQVSGFQPKALVGAAGAFETLAEIDIRHLKKEYPNDLPTVYEISPENFKKMSDKIISSTHEELFQLKGMAAFRVPMIVVASLVIRFVLNRMNIEKLYFSDYSIKEGVLWHVTR